MAYFKRQKIRGTTPLDIKSIDDNFASLFLKLFGNIDGGDIVEGSITGANIAAGTITAENIAAGAITADAIAVGALVVGTNVTMGADATIAWSKVTGTTDVATKTWVNNNMYDDSDALAAWEASNYATYIDANGVYTGNLVMGTARTIEIGAVGDTCALRITSNEIDTLSTSGHLWLNYDAEGSQIAVIIGDGSGSTSGRGALYAGNIYSNGTLLTNGSGEVTVNAVWA